MLRWVVFAAFVLAGLLTAGIGAWQGWDEARRASTWTETEGRIAGFVGEDVPVKRRITREGGKTVERKDEPLRVTRPVVQYPDSAGEVRENVLLRSRGIDEGTPPGTPIRVRFDPANPERVEQAFADPWVTNRVSLAIAGGLLFVLFGCVVLFAFAPKGASTKPHDLGD